MVSRSKTINWVLSDEDAGKLNLNIVTDGYGPRIFQESKNHSSTKLLVSSKPYEMLASGLSLLARYRGSISAEHGIGSHKVERLTIRGRNFENVNEEDKDAVQRERDYEFGEGH